VDKTWRIVAERVAALAVLLVLLSFGVFALLDLAPGDTLQSLLPLSRSPTPEQVRAIEEKYNLGGSFFEQYTSWAGRAVTLDFGESVQTSEPVIDRVWQSFRVSATVGIGAFVVAMLLGVPLGILAAYRHRSSVDRGIVGFGILGVSAPAFAVGLLLIWVFAVLLGILPAFGEGSGGFDRVRHMILPVATAALTVLGLVIKFTRASVVATLEQDYVVFARARGLSEAEVIRKYALPNALIPIITAGGFILAYLLAGVVLVEVTFSLPGLGAALVEAIEFQDIPVVQGIVVFTAVIIVVVNLVVDLLYRAIDPRLRFGEMAS
jgi:peptide/nickel transport system permease protein